MKLSELEIGDEFYPKSMAEKATPIFKVLSPCWHNPLGGSTIRKCLNLKTQKEVSKLCRLEVILNKRAKYFKV